MSIFNKKKKISQDKEELESVAIDVINGKYGNGLERKKLLEDAGYDYYEIQSIVEKIVFGVKEEMRRKTDRKILKIVKNTLMKFK